MEITPEEKTAGMTEKKVVTLAPNFHDLKIPADNHEQLVEEEKKKEKIAQHLRRRRRRRRHLSPGPGDKSAPAAAARENGYSASGGNYWRASSNYRAAPSVLLLLPRDRPAADAAAHLRLWRVGRLPRDALFFQGVHDAAPKLEVLITTWGTRFGWSDRELECV